VGRLRNTNQVMWNTCEGREGSLSAQQVSPF